MSSWFNSSSLWLSPLIALTISVGCGEDAEDSNSQVTAGTEAGTEAETEAGTEVETEAGTEIETEAGNNNGQIQEESGCEQSSQHPLHLLCLFLLIFSIRMRHRKVKMRILS